MPAAYLSHLADHHRRVGQPPLSRDRRVCRTCVAHPCSHGSHQLQLLSRRGGDCVAVSGRAAFRSSGLAALYGEGRKGEWQVKFHLSSRWAACDWMWEKCNIHSVICGTTAMRQPCRRRIYSTPPAMLHSKPSIRTQRQDRVRFSKIHLSSQFQCRWTQSHSYCNHC